MTTILLGDTARDSVISRHEYLNGCVRLTLQPRTLQNGKPIEPDSFDLQQLKLVKRGRGSAMTGKSPPGGPPRLEPKRPLIPQR